LRGGGETVLRTTAAPIELGDEQQPLTVRRSDPSSGRDDLVAEVINGQDG
jgi:hypothetical protein